MWCDINRSNRIGEKKQAMGQSEIRTTKRKGYTTVQLIISIRNIRIISLRYGRKVFLIFLYIITTILVFTQTDIMKFLDAT